MQGGHHVVAVASEKGGVGKTTIATNLAVYLKAMDEDLPVTIASFDNHFTVDQMFALGPAPQGPTAADLFGEVSSALEPCLGEYGVRYLPSARRLEPPDACADRLLRRLAQSGLSGILILDTRPLLDYFTRNALRTADLILAPVKDRAALVNVASILRTLQEDGGSPERLWVVPSLIDKRLKLRGEMGMEDFLACGAAERGYNVFEPGIAKSPKVEGLASGFSSRVYPVLTHARGTVVHGQFVALARFVRERLKRCGVPNHQRSLPAVVMAESPPGRLRRLADRCPVCGGAANGESGHFFFDLRSRRRGFIHPGCGRALLESTDVEVSDGGAAFLAVSVGEGRDRDGATPLHVHLFDREGEPCAHPCSIPAALPWPDFLGRIAAQTGQDALGTVILVTLEGGAPVGFLDQPAHGRFLRVRGRMLRAVTEFHG